MLLSSVVLALRVVVVVFALRVSRPSALVVLLLNSSKKGNPYLLRCLQTLLFII
jgi:hypothetical protein